MSYFIIYHCRRYFFRVQSQIRDWFLVQTFHCRALEALWYTVLGGMLPAAVAISVLRWREGELPEAILDYFETPGSWRDKAACGHRLALPKSMSCTLTQSHALEECCTLFNGLHGSSPLGRTQMCFHLLFWGPVGKRRDRVRWHTPASCFDSWFSFYFVTCSCFKLYIFSTRAASMCKPMSVACAHL